MMLCVLVLLLLHHYLTFNYFTENLFTFQEVCVCYLYNLTMLDFARFLPFSYLVCGWYRFPSSYHYQLVTMCYLLTVQDL